MTGDPWEQPGDRRGGPDRREPGAWGRDAPDPGPHGSPRGGPDPGNRYSPDPGNRYRPDPGSGYGPGPGPGGWGAPGRVPAPGTTNGIATAALVLGIVGLLLAGLVLPGLLLGGLAVVFGTAGVRRSAGGRAPHRGLAVAGMVTGGLAILLAAVAVALIAVLWGPIRDFGHCLDDTTDDYTPPECAGRFDGFFDEYDDQYDEDRGPRDTTVTAASAVPTPGPAALSWHVPALVLTGARPWTAGSHPGPDAVRP